MDFWRGEAYQAFFAYLESKGGFYYEVCLSSDLCHQGQMIDVPLCSAGVMHLSTASRRLFSLERTKFISSVMLGIDILPSSIAHRVRIGQKGDAHAIPRIVLVCFVYSSCFGLVLNVSTDYAPNSCISRYEKLFV